MPVRRPALKTKGGCNGEEELKMNITQAKLAMAAAGGWFFALPGSLLEWELAFITFLAIIMDYITGILAGRANEGLSSGRAVKGLYKKVGIIFLFCLGFLIDGAFNHYLAAGFGIEMPFELPIGLIVSVWIFLTEAISICENLERLKVPIPSWLMKLLRKTRKKIDKE